MGDSSINVKSPNEYKINSNQSTIQHLNKPKVNRKLVQTESKQKLVQTESKQTACTIRKQTESMYNPKINRQHAQTECIQKPCTNQK